METSTENTKHFHLYNSIFIKCLAFLLLITTTIFTVEAAYELLADSYYMKLPLYLSVYDKLLDYSKIIVLIAGIIIIIGLVIFEICAAGYKPGSEAPTVGYLDRIPFDITTVVLLGAALLAFAGWYEILDSSAAWYLFKYSSFCMVLSTADLFGSLALAAACAALGTLWLMSLAVRIKTGNVFKNTVIWRACILCWKILSYIWKAIKKGLKYIVTNVPQFWRILLGVLAIMFADFLVLIVSFTEHDFGFFCWLVLRLLMLAAVIYLLVSLKAIQFGAAELASGNTEHMIPTNTKFAFLNEHAANLNDIRLGMNRAVNDRVKSEHMKTELITNVSHDIKTPLTSIINYTDLISKEPTDNPRISEYCEVLTRQSDKLKRLINDLVEASKASTGNLEILPETCSPGTFLSQIAGEYEEKLAANELTLILKNSDCPAQITADPRRMRRIFDNIMNNACKYAQRGTRVYAAVELIRKADNTVLSNEEMNLADCCRISFKNTSAAELNISPDELMERFVRGDASRNTDGNGLGLSIARSLTELQGGSMDIVIDGDLFKVYLDFPLTR